MIPKNLTNHFLIAAPQMLDDRFSRSVVYIFRHDDEGMLGLVINQPIPEVSIEKLLKDLEIKVQGYHLHNRQALDGGPVHPEIGFVLHTGQPVWSSSFTVAENVNITTSRDILENIAWGYQAHDYQICLGHASWDKEQVVQEIEQGDWFIAPADLEIIFSLPFEKRWQAAGTLIELNLEFLTIDAGNA